MSREWGPGPVLLRALTYAAVFVGIVLVLLPARILARAGVARPEAVGPGQVVGAVLVVVGAALALWCVLAFAFDPPRRLVRRGPYRVVRNPMYLGAILALAGASLFFRSLVLFAFAIAFAGVTHAFVVLYEEPTLRGLFGEEYEDYRRQVRRWFPIPGARAASDA
ncbi:MAG: isoprenylcysteine carboxylmethyltransferase family protein [Gemmatimonadetes bacterium]|nr:isoprenylcysteine carboxylmethyltransferase family protein [Gemmatimonadota bacterium]NIQ59443.1 isoprenylcysteine carboxylmethyltransferase family protein [Gemmatimonadota bacterium]NIU79629.1 isoprenylcysteine carboxylmethyltransferase family protein [Gammaproteobacteria bacterium]NIX48210.1 isoprenylcysteine carboxylmethyltransferase family protein [Gemmatimonadota bacterium]NIY12643.1 isoprenylcysteine carboxylmethyltransferase family protein [Gemmatimonadota bacterium]